MQLSVPHSKWPAHSLSSLQSPCNCRSYFLKSKSRPVGFVFSRLLFFGFFDHFLLMLRSNLSLCTKIASVQVAAVFTFQQANIQMRSNMNMNNRILLRNMIDIPPLQTLFKVVMALIWKCLKLDLPMNNVSSN